MKKIIYLGLIFICVFVYGISNKQFDKLTSLALKSENIVYAKTKEQCQFFRTESMNQSVSNLWFEIPHTYFVSILSKVTDNIYKVQYNNYVGYVFADTISIVSFLPTTPTLENVTFDIKQNAGTQIWSTPSDSVRILTTISADTRKIEYVAAISGDIPVGGVSNIWYYAKYTPASYSTSVYEGYIYSESTINMSHIGSNLEYEPEQPTTNIQTSSTLGSTAQVIMIFLIVLPFLILTVLAIIKIARKLKLKQNVQIETTNKQSTNSSPQFIRKPKNKK